MYGNALREDNFIRKLKSNGYRSFPDLPLNPTQIYNPQRVVDDEHIFLFKYSVH
jgi:hypothetical protein